MKSNTSDTKRIPDTFPSLIRNVLGRRSARPKEPGSRDTVSVPMLTGREALKLTIIPQVSLKFRCWVGPTREQMQKPKRRKVKVMTVKQSQMRGLVPIYLNSACEESRRNVPSISEWEGWRQGIQRPALCDQQTSQTELKVQMEPEKVGRGPSYVIC